MPKVKKGHAAARRDTKPKRPRKAKRVVTEEVADALIETHKIKKPKLLSATSSDTQSSTSGNVHIVAIHCSHCFYHLIFFISFWNTMSICQQVTCEFLLKQLAWKYPNAEDANGGKVTGFFHKEYWKYVFKSHIQALKIIFF